MAKDMRYKIFKKNGVQDISLFCVATLYEALTYLHNNPSDLLYVVDSKSSKKITRRNKTWE